jgi:hypothetical protein
MTVAELIETLKNYDPNMRIVVNGYEGGYDEPQIKESTARLDTNFKNGEKETWYNGQHDWGGMDHENLHLDTPVLVVSRSK